MYLTILSLCEMSYPRAKELTTSHNCEASFSIKGITYFTELSGSAGCKQAAIKYLAKMYTLLKLDSCIYLFNIFL